jgi:hypothetical protein
MTPRKALFRCVAAALPLFTVGILAGCGNAPNFAGIYGPRPSATAPVVLSVSPGSVVAGGPAFTLTVTGKNFAPDMTVGGIATTSSTFISSTELQAQIPASAIANPGTLTIIAVTTPPSTLNFGAGFTIADAPVSGNSGFKIEKVPIFANDIVWSPSSQHLYLSAIGSSTSPANAIRALDPVTGQIGISQAVTVAPNKLSISSDGSYLYAGLDSSHSVQRFHLPGLGPDIGIPLGSDPVFGYYYAMQIASAPGQPHTVAVLRGALSMPSLQDQGGVVIYDDAQARSTSVPGAGYHLIGKDVLLGTIGTIRWKSDAGTIYARGGLDSANNFYVLSVNSSGVQAVAGYQAGYNGQQSGFGNFGTGLQYAASTGYLYSDGRQVMDPATGNIVAQFPVNAIGGGFNYGTDIMVPDGGLNLAYFLGQTQYQVGTQDYTLEAFDLTQFTLLGSIPIPNVIGTPVKLVRWGANGLAILTNNNPGFPIQGTGVYLISGAFVTSPAPQGRRAMN